MLALVIANGDLTEIAGFPDLPDKVDLVIAVDGGANHCHRLGIVPDILIGDLDSIAPDVLQGLQDKDVAMHLHPPRKDATDLELALDLAMERGARAIYLLAGLGGRWDMSLANVLLLASKKYQPLRCTVVEPTCTMYVLHPGTVFTVSGAPGQRVSLLPLAGTVRGVTLQGFEYPLKDATLHPGSTQGISNVFVGHTASVQFEVGILLCIHLHP